MKPIPALLSATSLSMCALGALASEAPKKALQAVRISEPIRMDGRLAEKIWSTAPAASNFATQWPEFGQKSSLRTEVRVLYDDRYLYIGAHLFHPDGAKGVVGRLHRRDQWSLSDWFLVSIDSLHDRNSALAFLVNPANVQRDALIFGDTNWDYSWDGVWESAVSSDDSGWKAMLKIPLSLLRMHATNDPQDWGINFTRDANGPIRESSVWELTPRGINAYVSRFPELTGLNGMKPLPRREWAPFIGLQRKFETANSYDDRAWVPTAGLDAHLSLNTYSQLDLTVHPDFGQVEADQASLNLSTFETWFPEKRPFFLDGMDIFQVAGSQLFYSRRIGVGLSNPDLAEGETLVDRPQTTNVAAAAKYTGKLQDGVSIGLLGAGVESADARIRRADGTPENREIYPYTSFGVGRLKRQLDERGSYVGSFVSYMDQAGSSNRQAWVSALDGAYKSEDRSTMVDATLAKSQAGPKEEQAQGHRERLGFSTRWQDGWWLNLGTANTTRAFNPNDVGFMGRPDEQRVDASLGRSYDQTWNVLRNWSWNLGGSWAQNQEGRVFQRTVWANAYTGFTNFCGVNLNAGVNLPSENDRELRTFDDPVRKYLPYGTLPWVGLGVSSPDNRPWNLSLNLNRGWREGGPSTNISLNQSIKLNSALELQLGTGATQNEGELSYLETQGETPIVGLRRLSSFNQTLRVAYAFSPNLTLQVFSQWLAANWNYRDLKSYVDDHTLAPGATSTNTAFSDRVWNANVITRWEFKPGSTFYVVYSHATSTDSVINDRATVSPAQDLAILGHLPSDDAVMVKLSYLFR